MHFLGTPRLRHVVDVGDEVLGVVLEENPCRPAKGGHDLVVGVENALEEVVGRDELVDEASGQNGGIRGKAFERVRIWRRRWRGRIGA